MASGLRRRAVVVPAIGVLVAGGGAVAWAQAGSGSAGYRTAVVTRGDVQQLLSLTGTVSVVDQAKAHFRAAGSVAAVKVTVGQKVGKGQVLATMDTGSLQDAVTRAAAALATAKATLETDQVSGSSSATPTPTPSASSSPSRGGSGGGLAGAQQAADRALHQATQALTAATAACATAPLPSATASSTTTPAPTATATASPTTAPATHVPSVLSCADALTASLRAQQEAARAQQALAQALASASSSSSSSSSKDSSTPSSDDSSSQRGSSTSTAARITTDTATVEAAQVQLSEAQKDLAAVSLTAPIAGTVASIPWTAGSSAAPTDSVVILGSGPVEVTVDVPSASIRSIRAGLAATVRGDGATKTVSGLVSRVGLLPTDSSGSSSSSSATTYPVVVRVPAGPGLVEGGAAAVSIAVKSVTDVVTVPNSALHDGGVDVLSKGKVARVAVQTGTVGALVTEVTSGLTAGQTVVLADLSEALPTSSTTGNRNGFGGPGGFSGPPVGFSGGPVTITRKG